jgi:hypothetical protein
LFRDARTECAHNTNYTQRALERKMRSNHVDVGPRNYPEPIRRASYESVWYVTPARACGVFATPGAGQGYLSSTLGS